MKVTLRIDPISPQEKVWCYDACLLNAISIRLWEKYKIVKTFNPTEFYERNFFSNVTTEGVLSAIKHEGLRGDIKFSSAYKSSMSKPSIDKHLLKRVPIIVQIDVWGVSNGLIVKGDKKGHFLIIYGFDDDYYYLQNPWGEDYYCKIKRNDKYMFGSFTPLI